MAMRFAIIGLPFSGKTTIHSALSGIDMNELPEVSPGSGIHLSTVHYDNDERLREIARIYNSRKITPISFELMDFPGFDFSAPSGREQIRRHIADVRQCDLLILVVRAFENDSVPRYRNRIDPQADLDELLEEFVFADMDQITRRIEKLEVSVKKPTPNRENDMKELDLLRRCLAALEQGNPIENVPSSEQEKKMLKTFALLTQHPIVVIINIDENQLDREFDLQIPNIVKGFDVCVGKFEQELAQLDPDDRKMFMEEAGLKEFSRDRLFKMFFAGLNTITFYTAGENEARAWTLESNKSAVDAAGKIHTDIARGFIRAETISYDDIIACGSEKQAKQEGKLRAEGKNYIVKDGDIILFRFNV